MNYREWNLALGSNFFNEANKDVEQWIFVDLELISDIYQNTHPNAQNEEALKSFIEALRVGLISNNGQPIGNPTRTAMMLRGAWRRYESHNVLHNEHFQNPTETIIPPYFAFLCGVSLAYSLDPAWTVGLKKLGLNYDVQDQIDLWEDLQKWANRDRNGHFGRWFLRRWNENVGEGIVAAQHMIRPEDKRRLHRIFIEENWDPNVPVADELLTEALSQRADIHYIAQNLFNSDRRPSLMMRIQQELKNWNGTYQPSHLEQPVRRVSTQILRTLSVNNRTRQVESYGSRFLLSEEDFDGDGGVYEVSLAIAENGEPEILEGYKKELFGRNWTKPVPGLLLNKRNITVNGRAVRNPTCNLYIFIEQWGQFCQTDAYYKGQKAICLCSQIIEVSDVLTDFVPLGINLDGWKAYQGKLKNDSRFSSHGNFIPVGPVGGIIIGQNNENNFRAKNWNFWHEALPKLQINESFESVSCNGKELEQDADGLVAFTNDNFGLANIKVVTEGGTRDLVVHSIPRVENTRSTLLVTQNREYKLGEVSGYRGGWLEDPIFLNVEDYPLSPSITPLESMTGIWLGAVPGQYAKGNRPNNWEAVWLLSQKKVFLLQENVTPSLERVGDLRSQRSWRDAILEENLWAPSFNEKWLSRWQEYETAASGLRFAPSKLRTEFTWVLIGESLNQCEFYEPGQQFPEWTVYWAVSKINRPQLWWRGQWSNQQGSETKIPVKAEPTNQECLAALQWMNDNSQRISPKNPNSAEPLKKILNLCKEIVSEGANYGN